MGAGRLIGLLSWVLALFGPTDWRRGWSRSKHHTEPGTHEWGLESKFGRGPGPLDRRVVGWSYLCLGYKRAMCFGVPSWCKVEMATRGGVNSHFSIESRRLTETNAELK